MTMSRDQEVEDSDDNPCSPETSDGDVPTGMSPEVTFSPRLSADHSKRRDRESTTARTAVTGNIAASRITSSRSKNQNDDIQHYNNSNNGNNSNNSNDYRGNRDNTRFSSRTSQHTEIEFYSSDEDRENGDDIDDEDDSDNDDDASFNGDTDEDDDIDDHSSEFPGAGGPCGVRRPSPLQRDQSMHSISSDAYSLPVGSQDDVSSLECDDNVPTYGVDDISLEDEDETNNDKEQPKQISKMKPMVVVDMSEKSPVPTSRKVLGRKSPLLQRKPSISALLPCMDFLPELPDEDEHDDSEHAPVAATTTATAADEERSVQMNDLLQEASDEEIDDVASRLHRSLFVPRMSSPLEMHLHAAASSSSNTLHAEWRKRGTASVGDGDGGRGSGSASGSGGIRVGIVRGEEYERLAKSLPPELDLELARKYIAQLAEGVPEAPSLRDSAKFQQRKNSHRSILSTSTSASNSSEEIEIEEDADDEVEEEVVDADDDDDDTNEDRKVDSRIPTSPKDSRSRRRNAAATPESTLSYDFTEVVDEIEDEEIIIEEVIQEEDEEEEVIYEEEEEEEDPTPPHSSVTTPGVVGTAS